MKKLLILAGCAMMLALSCAKETDAPEMLQKGDIFYAAIEDVDSKVFADDQLRVLWHQNDLISIFNKYTYNKQYKFNGNTGDNAGSFSEVPSSDFVTGNTLPLVYAIYPYNEGTSISNDGVINLTFPATQTYSKNSFGIGANPMVSVSEDHNLLFKNVGGYLMLKFYGEACIKTIQLQATQKIAGAATVTMDLGGTPVIAMADNASSTITLDCGAGVVVGTTEANYTEFWFALPPVNLSSGFTVTVTDVYGQTFTKRTTNALTISRNHLEKMSPIALSMPHTGSSSDNIVFADADLKALLVEEPTINTNGDSEISFAEAAAVTSFPEYFFIYKSFKSFTEFKYFTKIYSIPERFFYGCFDLEEIMLPPYISSIGDYAFEMCSSLTALDVPETCKSVGSDAFSDCRNLKTLIFRSPTRLDLDYTCFGMTGMCEAETLIIYAEQAFDPGMHYSGVANGNGLKVAGTVYVPAKSIVRYQELWHQLENQIKPIPETFDQNISFADATVKQWLVKSFDTNGDGQISYREAAAVQSFSDGFFYDKALTGENSDPNLSALTYTSFDELEYFSSLTEIPSACFYMCSELKSVKLPRSVTSIGTSAFEGCSKLTSLIGPRKLTEIGYMSFSSTGLKDVTLYADTLDFAGLCFQGCDLNTLTLYATSVPVFSRYLFSSVNTMYVPDPAAYQNDQYWSQYAYVSSYQQIPDYEVYYHTHYN